MSTITQPPSPEQTDRRAAERNYAAHRNTRYDTMDCVAACELLRARGWSFDYDSRSPRSGWPGWWIHPEHETKRRRTGDSKPMFQAALDTVALYTDITPDEVLALGRQFQREERDRLRAAAAKSAKGEE